MAISIGVAGIVELLTVLFEFVVASGLATAIFMAVTSLVDVFEEHEAEIADVLDLPTARGAVTIPLPGGNIFGMGVGTGIAMAEFMMAEKTDNIPEVGLEDMPEDVQDSYGNYDEHDWSNEGKPSPNTKDKKPFGNNQEKLPDGEYEEFRVNKKDPTGGKEDSERFVRDKNKGDVYYTDDHYGSFKKIK